MKWHAEPLLGFDTETTGVDVWNDRIVSACLIEVDAQGATVAHDWLINPGVPIPDGAEAVHGISTERAQREGRPPAEVLEEITAHLAAWMGRGRPVVVFNASFDLTILEVENARHGVPSLASRLDDQIAPVLDPLVIDKHVDAFRKGKRLLTIVAGHYGVDLGKAHDAQADALAAAALIPKIFAKYPDLTDFSPDELHDAQVRWRHEQQSNLADYFARVGKPEVAASLSSAWPIEPNALN